MPSPILHHFDISPFSEKVRLVLGFKGLAWQSVQVPKILPKPDVVALTGGYRRTPFLQIGADIHCDTALMCRVIDAIAPEPPLYPAESRALSETLAQWADSALFWSAIPFTMQPAGAVHVMRGETPEFMEAMRADRTAMTAGMRRATTADAGAALQTYLARLESMLADGRRFLFGAQASIGDFAAAQSIWFMRLAPPIAAALKPFPSVEGWYERVAAFGHGQRTEITSADAIAAARAATGHAPCTVEPGLGFEAGAAVTVSATDYATDAVPGTLVGLTRDEVVVERTDERAGRLHVHFPRLGFQIRKEKSA
jgi:glutathione S-transferase